MPSAVRNMAPLIPLSDAEIHLWLTFDDEIRDESLHSAYRSLLNDAEREQEPRFHFERDRRRYLITRALVRTVLSRYLPIHPADWIFSANAYGRPEIVNAEAREASLLFNLSHTHGLIVLGVTRGRELGVDVENLSVRKVSLGIADRFFSPPEVTALKGAPPHLQQFRFFEYWTFKESYIKARGMGLSLPLDKFSFHYPDDRTVKIEIDPELADEPSRRQFRQFRPTPDHLLAVCAERTGSRFPSLIVRQTVPMSSERPLSLEALRASD